MQDKSHEFQLIFFFKIQRIKKCHMSLINVSMFSLNTQHSFKIIPHNCGESDYCKLVAELMSSFLTHQRILLGVGAPFIIQFVWKNNFGEYNLKINIYSCFSNDFLLFFFFALALRSCANRLGIDLEAVEK